MPKPNVELLEKTLTYIRDHPEEWKQNEWICDTAACFAGHACLLSGMKRLYYKGSTILSTSRVRGENGKGFPIPEMAASLLGLSGWQKHQLFRATNNFDDLEIIVKDIVNEAKQELNEDV